MHWCSYWYCCCGGLATLDQHGQRQIQHRHRHFHTERVPPYAGHRGRDDRDVWCSVRVRFGGSDWGRLRRTGSDRGSVRGSDSGRNSGRTSDRNRSRDVLRGGRGRGRVGDGE